MHDGSLLQLLYCPQIAAASSGGATLSAANAFTAANTFSLAVAGNNVSLATTDAGAVGSTLRLYHNTASPANSDVTGIITFDGKDSGAADQVWANIRAQITDVTAASEDANVLIQTVVAGTVATRVTVGAGLQIGAPTGGDVANSINVSGTLRVNNDPAATLAAANAFTAAQSITLAVAGNNLTLGTTDAGALGSTLVLDHNTASPANADVPGVITFSGRDSGAGAQAWANIKAVITDVTAASEDAEIRFETPVAGTIAGRVRIGAGLYTDGATGGDQGTNSINASNVYDDGVLLANQVAATQAEMESAASTAVFSSPARQQFHPGHPKAWASWVGATPGTNAPLAGYNVATVQRVSAGNYVITFTTAFSSANYIMTHAHLDAASNATGQYLKIVSKTASTCTVRFNVNGAATDVDEVHVSFFGDQ